MSIRIFTLGTLRVLRGEEELIELPRQRLRCALLIHLAMERRGSRDAVAALLWPERREERAKHSLSQALYELRQDLGPDVTQASGDLLMISEDLWIDALELKRAVEQERWREGLDLYGGAFLDGSHLVASAPFESWADRWQSRTARLHRRARSSMLSQHRAAEELDEALEVARAWVEFEPLDDEAHHVLIELLAESGRRGEALRQFEDYRALIARELDVEPLEQTRALIDRVRQGGSGEAAKPLAPAERPAGTGALIEDDGSGESGSVASGTVADGGGPVPPRLPVPRGGWSENQLIAELAPDLEVDRPLGTGLMATVYLATELPLRRRVAVKVLRAELARDTTSRLRFEREAQSAAKISHPHVATIFAVGALSSGTPYIVMEYVEGPTLQVYRAGVGVMDVGDIRRMVGEVASALAAAHAEGIVHRDVRPANVLVEEATGRAVLSDFGVAALLEQGEDAGPRLTKTGEIVGHPIYLSPEQLVGDRVGPEADIYSLGMLAYELLTAEGDEPDLMALARLRSQRTRISAVRADVGRRFEALVERCLAAHPEDRPTAAEVAAELTSPLPDDPGRAGALSREAWGGLVRRWFGKSDIG